MQEHANRGCDDVRPRLSIKSQESLYDVGPWWGIYSIQDYIWLSVSKRNFKRHFVKALQNSEYPQKGYPKAPSTQLRNTC